MITMDMYDYIRFSHYNLKKSINKIHQDTKKAKETIRKAIKGIEPGYRKTKAKKKPLMDEHLEVIKEWLVKDKEAPKKQRHTAERIYGRLVEEYDFKGSSRTVRKTVKELKEKLEIISKEAFIPSDPEKRKGYEVDWGEALIDISGSRTKAYMFCMRGKYSGKIYVKLYPVMVQECFFNGHIESFAYLDGVPEEIIYDNLKTAVQRVLRGQNRIEQKSFLSFRSYYSYTATYCNTNSGNEKGGVESLVKYARRNYLTPIPKCNSWEEINKKLLEKCFTRDLDKTDGHDKTIGELFEKEKEKLLKLPARPYNNYKLIETKVDKFLVIKVDKNRYSVPAEYANKKVTIELGLSNVRITCQNRLIARHERNYQKNQWVLNPWHYMSLLCRKPRAFETSRILSCMEKSWDPIAIKLWKSQKLEYGEIGGTKEFIETLLLFKDKDHSEMIALLELAVEDSMCSKENIKALFESLTEEDVEVEDAIIQNIEALVDFTIPQANVDKFDALMGENDG